MIRGGGSSFTCPGGSGSKTQPLWHVSVAKLIRAIGKAVTAGCLTMRIRTMHLAGSRVKYRPGEIGIGFPLEQLRSSCTLGAAPVNYAIWAIQAATVRTA